MRRSVVGFVATVVAIAALQSTALIGVTSSAWAEEAPVAPPVVEVDAPAEVVPEEEVDTQPEVEVEEEVGVQAEPDAEPDVNVQAGTSVAGDFTLYRVKLIEGTQAYANAGTVAVAPTVDASRTGAISATASSENVLDVAVDYRIEMLDKPTEWGIRAGLKTGGFWGEYGTCSIEFRPVVAGTPRPEKDPFTCSVSTVDHGHVKFHVELNDSGESSGSLTTQGDRITLMEGDFVQGLPYSIPGTLTVGKNTTTTFATVLREGDSAIDENQARTQFSYRIVDNGVPTNLYVAGWTTNFRGTTKFSGDGHCGIYSVEPKELTNIKLENVQEDISAYTCTGSGGFVHDEWSSGNNHWKGDYTVSRRNTIVETDPGAQTRLVQNYCGIENRCGLTMSTVTSAYMHPTLHLTDEINGPARVTYTKAHTEGVSISNGFKISAEAETNWLFEKLKFTLEYNFEMKTKSETTSETGYEFEVKEGETAYLEGAPMMVRADGVVIVIDNTGAYWELPGFSASFPKVTTDKGWYLHVQRTPIVGAVPTPGDGTTPPAVVTPVATQVAAQPATGRLANTGVETPALPGLLAVSLLGAGALVTAFTVRRRRGAPAK